jgi:rRNA maturation protein Nop10
MATTMEQVPQEMHYTITCDECGEDIAKNVLATDFYKDSIIGSYRIKLLVHNECHGLVWDVVDSAWKIDGRTQ